MPPSELRALLAIQPFQPFRVHLSNGSSYLIRHPDMVVIGRSTFRVVLPADAEGEKDAIISLLHVIQFEIIAPIP